MAGKYVPKKATTLSEHTKGTLLHMAETAYSPTALF